MLMCIYYAPGMARGCAHICLCNLHSCPMNMEFVPFYKEKTGALKSWKMYDAQIGIGRAQRCPQTHLVLGFWVWYIWRK